MVHLFPKLFGLHLSSGEVKLFFYFVFYLLCLLNFFYAAGLFLRVLCQEKPRAIIYILIFWLFSVSIVPGVLTSLLKNKSRVLPATEASHTMSLDTIERMARKYENVTQFYPTGFFLFLSGELSSRGYYGYIDLVKYTQGLQSAEGEKNIFKASGRLPRSFVRGTCFTLVFTFIFFLASYIVLRKRKRLREMPVREKPRYNYRKGSAYFILCGDEQIKNGLFAYYRTNKDAVCIDNVHAREIDTGAGLSNMLTYFCKIAGVEEETAVKNLRILAIGDPWNRKWQKEKLPDEVVLKLYCAVLLAEDRRLIVVNDFLMCKSPEMQRQFFYLVTRLINSGKILLYLGTEMFLTLSPFEGNIKVNGYKDFKIVPQAVSLR
jgi:hypothetical protein